jgi:GTP cyclohydrolase I
MPALVFFRNLFYKIITPAPECASKVCIHFLIVQCRRLQIQERLTREIAAAVSEAVEPSGEFFGAKKEHSGAGLTPWIEVGPQGLTMSPRGVSSLAPRSSIQRPV